MILEDKLVKELNEYYNSLSNEGKLLSKAQLETYYETFRKKFGPDRLKNLDGEALLLVLHDNLSRDSLVYWLEYKDDDELPMKFGSIAGGSALKFTIYRRKETGAWMTGTPLNQRELSTAQTIEFARRHRDQLIQGSMLLEALSSNASDSEYKNLQENMNRLAPDVGDLSWGHKYFSMLYPDKLDDYHNPDFQRFYLIKLLQIPPAGEGRYIAAGRYVAIAHELGIPLNNLTTILNKRHGRPHRYWRVGTSDSTQPRNRWAIMRDNHCVAIGWSELGDLSGVMHDKNSKEKIRIDMATLYPKTPQQVGKATQQVFNFVAAISEGDVVIAADGETVLGIGKIIGGYTFTPSFDFPHCRPVEWLSLEEWRFPTMEGLRTTVHEFKNNANKVEIERCIFEASPIISTPANRPQKPSLLHRFTGLLGRIQSVLERKRQVILYGPPGTGKTYWADVATRELAAHSNFGVSFDELSSEQSRLFRGGENSRSLVRMCCFHPAYGYEDFLEGYRPEAANGQMSFVLRDGIFKKLCKDAQSTPELKYYLIIDEINRGDIPRIFGELLTVLEKNKRGTSILLPLTGTAFQVPDNIFIIGTMNTADRSIALLDTALRRRFGFIELMPDSTILGDAAVAGIPLGPWLDALNHRICDHIGRDSRNLQIGHSYLLDGVRPVTDFAKFFKIIQDDIIPLLEEYCYEDYSKLEKILGKGLVDLENQRIRQELFDIVKQDELVQALLTPCPEIGTTSQAMASEVETIEDENDEAHTAGEEQ